MGIFRLPSGTEMTLSTLDKFLGLHKQEVTKRYEPLLKAYMSDHEIVHQKEKPKYKPDNRIVVNFPKYITDTFDGFAIGNPIKVVADDDNVADFVEYLNRYNDQDDNDAELFKFGSIFGSGFEMYYADEEAELCTTYLSPIEAFMIYDDSIVERPMYFVRCYKDWENKEYGSISNAYGVRHFQITGGLKWTDEDWKPHHFPDVPATEFIANEERQGIFEPVMSQVNAFNKAISEKANDVDYFADAYLKVLGAKVEPEDVNFIRDNRVVNFEGEGADKIIAEFMGKPESDTAQENLLNRLERLIFQISMVANISDENFGASSGIALRYKLLAMHNLANTRHRKFESGMNRRYKILFGHPVSKAPADAWVKLRYHNTANIPANLLEEVQAATQLEGIVSRETQLKVLSIVDNVQDELDKMEAENAPSENDSVTNVMFGDTVASAMPQVGAEEVNDEQQAILGAAGS